VASDWIVKRSERELVRRVGVEWAEYDVIREVVTAGERLGRFPLLDRLGDYFDDCEWQTEEIPRLRDEMLELGGVPGLSLTASETVRCLVELCDVAVRERKSVKVVAD
jgi:hypothetical protein